MAKTLSKRNWIFLISIFVAIIVLAFFIWNILSNKKIEYIRKLLGTGQGELAIKTLEGNPWLIKRSKDFLLAHSLALISKKIHTPDNFYINDLNAVRQDLEMLTSMSLTNSNYQEVGFIYENINMRHEALNYYLKALDGFSKKDIKEKTELLSDVAHIYESLKDTKKAKEYYEKSLELDNSNILARWRYAARVLDIGIDAERTKAKTIANDIIKSNDLIQEPIKEDMYNLLGDICLFELKDNDTSKECLNYYLKSLEFNSKYPNTYDRLISYYLSPGLDDLSLFYILNKEKISKEQMAKAFEYITKDISTDNTRAIPFIYSSIVNELMGQKGTAKSHLQKALLLIDRDASAWGETKNIIKAIIYFKMASLENNSLIKNQLIKKSISIEPLIKENIKQLISQNPENISIKSLLVGVED